MGDFEITRQHDDTSMTEIVGEQCQQFIAVCERNNEIYHIFYLKLSGIYHRFHMDAGCLFWQSGTTPDEDDDLYGGDRYIDLGHKYGLEGSLVERVSYRDDRLDMKFSNGVELLFEEGIDDVGARMIV